jgi:hypothetical protein
MGASRVGVNPLSPCLPQLQSVYVDAIEFCALVRDYVSVSFFFFFQPLLLLLSQKCDALRMICLASHTLLVISLQTLN